MSLIDQDDAFAAELRTLADVAQPPLDLDPTAVTRGGRALRRRRAVRTGVVVTLASAAVVVGVTQLVNLDPPDTQPAHPTQEPRPFGDGQTVELAPGVVAANRPETVEVAGRVVQDLGFTSHAVGGIGEDETAPLPTVIEPYESVETVWDSGESVTASGAFLHNVDGDKLRNAMDTAWLDDESEQRHSFLPSGDWSLSAVLGRPNASHEQIVLGSVPSWLAEPRVELFSARGFDLDDSSFSHTVEVPTFRSLNRDGRLLFALKITEEQGEYRGDDAEMLVDVVIYRSGDGSVFVGNQCGAGGLDACLEQYGGPFLAAAGLPTGDTMPGDIAVIATPLLDLAGTSPGSSSGWGVGGGRWAVQSVVDGVVVANNFIAPGAETIDDGPWDSFVVGIDVETGGELWRWEIGDGAHPNCGPAHAETGHGPSVLECWWYPDDDSRELRHSFHDARTATVLAENTTDVLEMTDWPSYGGYSDRVVVDGLLVGPRSDGSLEAVDPSTGDVAWHHPQASRVLGTDGVLVYALLEGWGEGHAVVVGLDPLDGSETWRTELGDDVIDVVPVDGYLFAIHGTDYYAFELGFSRVG